MDPYSFSLNTARELCLRRHIREVLLLYARTHLVSDHVAFTEMAVEKLLLQVLEYVPMADATLFLLPTDPIEILLDSLHSFDLIPLEEKWATSSEHLTYLRTIFPPLRLQDLPTEKCWLEGDHRASDTGLSLICRPLSPPELSKRSRRETPSFGGSHSRASIPRTVSALMALLDPDSVSVPSIDDFPPLPVDDILDLRIKLDAATGALVRPLLQSVLGPNKRDKFVENTPYMSEFLHRESPPRYPPRLDSPPLFPRIAKGMSTRRGPTSDFNSDIKHPTHFSDLAPMVQVVSPQLIDGENGDIGDCHMEVVSGWTTLRYSSPPPPSLHSSRGSEVDELWDVSRPGTPATSLMAAKMDEVEIPRIRKFGHKNTLVNESNGAAALLTATNSPGFFITSFISAPIPMPQTQKPFTHQLEGVGSGMHSPHPLSPGQGTPNSLLGQPPSVLPEGTNVEMFTSLADDVEDIEGQRLDDAVVSIYASTSQDPLCYIMEEKLDDKDILLMDVPNLPPPTTHPKDDILFPIGTRNFIAPKGELARLDAASCEIKVFGPTAFLRPAKGIKPLALDLSWRPFNFGKTIPTDDEVAGVAEPIQSGVGPLGYHDGNYEELASIICALDASTSAEYAHSTQTRGCEELGTSPAPKRAEENPPVEYLLTQRERKRVSGTCLMPETISAVHSSVDIEQDITPWPYDGDILAELENIPHAEHQGSRDAFDPMDRNWINNGTFDDSGTDIMNNNLAYVSSSEFGVPLLLLRSFQDNLPNDVDIPMANDDQSENKENEPPADVDDYQQAKYQEHQPDSLATQYDWSGYFEFPESETFEPLSFASQSQLLGRSDDLANSTAQNGLPLTPSAPRHAKRSEDRVNISTSEHEHTDSRTTKRRRLDDLVPASSRDLFHTFIGLRNQIVPSDRTLDHPETRDDTPIPHGALDVPEQIILPRGTPDDVFDQHTVRLPEPWIPAAAIHRYLASVALIQKRALVCELQGHHCRVDLFERYDLGGADIIVDPEHSVLLVSLLALPAHLESTLERISRESWRYSRLLVVLEAFPSAQSYRADRSRDNGPVPYAYTPPVCKAISKLRRNLGIAEGCGTMNPTCTITWAFANDVKEAAKFVRCFGEEACATSSERSRGLLWDGREWLEEEREGESDLARVQGMNAFAAFVMLYDRSLDAILDLSPEARLADFDQLLGEERMRVLNAVIKSRQQQFTPDVADSALSGQTSSADRPVTALNMG